MSSVAFTSLPLASVHQGKGNDVSQTRTLELGTPRIYSPSPVGATRPTFDVPVNLSATGQKQAPPLPTACDDSPPGAPMLKSITLPDVDAAITPGPADLGALHPSAGYGKGSVGLGLLLPAGARPRDVRLLLARINWARPICMWLRWSLPPQEMEEEVVCVEEEMAPSSGETTNSPGME